MPIKAIILVGHGKDCPYCGRTMSILGKSDDDAYPTREHIKPRAHGGGLRIIVCRKCNLDKQCNTIRDWHRELLGAGDERAPVVGAFIDAMPSGWHQKLARQYELEADSIHRKELSDGRKELVRERRSRVKAARRGRLKRRRNRGVNEQIEKPGDGIHLEAQD